MVKILFLDKKMSAPPRLTHEIKFRQRRHVQNLSEVLKINTVQPGTNFRVFYLLKPTVSTFFSPPSMLSLSPQPCSAHGLLENISSKLFSWRLRHMTQFLEMSQLLHRFNKEIIECIIFKEQWQLGSSTDKL